MTITCPYCHARARLTPSLACRASSALPQYVLHCTGCGHRSVTGDRARQALAEVGAGQFGGRLDRG